MTDVSLFDTDGRLRFQGTQTGGGGSLTLPVDLGPGLFGIADSGITTISPNDPASTLELNSASGIADGDDVLIIRSSDPNTVLEVAVDGSCQLFTAAGSAGFKVQPASITPNGVFHAANNGDAKLSFFDATPVVQQNVPMTTPSVQDVIDALVALGLVEQSD